MADIPPQHGRVAVVTGGTNGIGFETALALAGAGARVVLSARDAAKGRDAIARIQARHPAADVAQAPLDLARLSSVRAFADEVGTRVEAIDLLVNNAGLLAPPTRQVTADGFEMQFGVNFLGHFALTGWLLPHLLRAPAARVVSLSSLAHRRAAMRFDDLQSERRYRAMQAYSQSKLAMLLFARELHRRSHALGWSLASLAAHPGLAMTNIATVGPRMGRDPARKTLIERAFQIFGPVLAQDSARGALPTLRAATAPEAAPGGYFGPSGLNEMRGPPAPARVARQAKDAEAGRRLWAEAERLTGVRFAELPA